MTEGAEHDAWLREALRHAPDSGAAPPSAVSAVILAEARAATARPTTPSGMRRAAASANPLLVFWAWLARPAVAAGFASVMAATLVGLMWWDWPMDETLPRAPALERNEAPRAPAAAAPTVPAAPAAAARPGDRSDGPRPSTRQPQRLRPRSRKPGVKPRSPTAPTPAAPRTSPQGSARRHARALPRPPFLRAKANASAPTLRQRGRRSKTRRRRPRRRRRLQRPRRSRRKQAAPAAVPAPAPSGRLGADEARIGASARGDVAAAAKSVAPRSAVAEGRSREADALAPSGSAAQNEPPARLRREATAMTASPLAPLLAALSGEGSHPSRQAAGGAPIAVEPSWRDWLIDLDVAAAGRWRRTADVREQATADADGQLPATLRLAIGGRPAAIVRIDGTTAHLETLGAAPARWQATLAPGDAERLRATAARLPP